MTKFWLPAALLAAAGTVWAASGEYAGRRAALARELPGSAIVLFGRTALDCEDNRTGFRQEPNFLYLSGWQEPGAVLLIAPGADILFLPRPDARRQTYYGKMLSPDDPGTAAATGFATVLPMDRFDPELKRAAGHGAKVYTIGEDGSGRLHKALGAEPANPAPAIARLRMVKSAGELELIRKSAEASMAAHRAAWKRTAPGLYEYQVAATMVETYADRGCERSAYAPVVGSGPNAMVLHYAKNNRRMDKGELLLMDVGAECAGYAGDITRTVPVSGRFSRRQREVYEVVLGAEKAAIAAVKPGMKVPELTKVARDYMDAHGGLGKYLAHGISHHIGLEVHDAQDLSVPLAEGMVISIEPGIYIPEENIGVRIEDMVLVTADGAKVLTEALPREAGQIEKAVGK
jgi:Xaa-Pro aminopeptidase